MRITRRQLRQLVAETLHMEIEEPHHDPIGDIADVSLQQQAGSKVLYIPGVTEAAVIAALQFVAGWIGRETFDYIKDLIRDRVIDKAVRVLAYSIFMKFLSDPESRFSSVASIRSLRTDPSKSSQLLDDELQEYMSRVKHVISDTDKPLKVEVNTVLEGLLGDHNDDLSNFF